MAWAFDRPCPMTQQPFIPRRGAPPYSEGSIRLRTARKAGMESQAPTFVRVERVSSSRRSSTIDSASVSLAFRTTLPVKPSMTITSALPVNRSCPSTLPMKLRRRALQDLVDFLGELVPLGLLLAHAHEADAGVRRAEDVAGEGAAHDRELLEVRALQWAFAPTSRSTVRPLQVGDHGGEGGPVHLLERAQHDLGDRPAGRGVARGEERVGLAVAHASPAPTWMEDRFFRVERLTFSPIPTTSGASTTSMGSERPPRSELRLHHVLRPDERGAQAELAAGEQRLLRPRLPGRGRRPWRRPPPGVRPSSRSCGSGPRRYRA